MKENFGRRREVALRVKLLLREEAFQEELQRLLRRSTEAIRKDDPEVCRSALEKVASVAETMLTSLGAPDSGTQARLLSAYNAVTALSEELHIQDQKRLGLESIFTKSLPQHPIPTRLNAAEHAEVLVSEEMLKETTPTVIVDQSPIPEVPGLEITGTLPDVHIHAAESTTLTFPSMTPQDDAEDSKPTHELIRTSGEQQTMFSYNPSPGQTAMLGELRQVSRRYDDLQQSFRDCHLALQDLKKEASSGDRAGRSSMSTEVVSATLERLDDYTEDARVELEIRVADEILLSRGYETLLILPGDGVDANMTAQIQAFTDGSDSNVRKAQQNLQRKLDDIQHDIAALKRFVFDPDNTLLQPTSEEVKAPAPSSSHGWSSWMTPSRPIGPAPGPTFGDVMSSPSLRRSHSRSLLQQKAPSDPLVDLGLRIAMPRRVSTPSVAVEASGRGPRQRTTSTMYMLGLGARPSPPPSNLHQAPPKPHFQALDSSDDVE